ncbi:hypothetical protein PPL_01770 [Heterostelium album PN500]|uniref:Uncharacterized protein n=1 Tax=Heterostelium pallidum (strain ATCC 26659 / Pp 5 / PN500) TaxID=670386 RepID=D3B0F4_HETP5|nr:hypothetical protein PPL_01770 [Heterostelium album PN500]EFA84778.1 hypothetical protein PPL_01770 [Heterostelium album PN500]|eukprot:XP_020436890.1 hypothetical protein PPL_01770 [Heterostelium album PN500]
MSIYVTRHGLREDWVNREWRKTAARPSDPPLSADGFVVASELGEACKSKYNDIQHIICSPMERCVQTANEIAKRLNLKIKIDNGVIEYLGHNPDEQLQPLSIEELAKLYPIDTTYQPSTTYVPGAETEQDVLNRTKKAFVYFSEKFENQTYIIVTHAATLIAICRSIINDTTYPFRSGVCSLTKFVESKTAINPDDKWTVEFTGEVSYLKKGEQFHWTFPKPNNRNNNNNNTDKPVTDLLFC